MGSQNTRRFSPPDIRILFWSLWSSKLLLLYRNGSLRNLLVEVRSLQSGNLSRSESCGLGFCSLWLLGESRTCLSLYSSRTYRSRILVLPTRPSPKSTTLKRRLRNDMSALEQEIPFR